MANLINANSNQNYFQSHGSHYKYEKGVLLCFVDRASLYNLVNKANLVRSFS